MIDLDLGEELELLVQTARSFSREQLLPHLRAAESAREVAAPVRAAFAQIGLAGLELPESLGGAGLGPLARVLVNEELGAGDPGAALALDALGPPSTRCSSWVARPRSTGWARRCSPRPGGARCWCSPRTRASRSRASA